MDFHGVFGLAGILLVLGVVLFVWSHRIRRQQGLAPSSPSAVGRGVRVGLVGHVLVITGVVMFLMEAAPPLAIVLLLLTATWVALCSRGQFRRIHVESVTTFRCCPEKAFALLADPRKQPLYYSEIERIEVLSPGEIGVGTVYRGWVRIPAAPGRYGLYLIADDEVVAYEPARTFATRIVGKSAQTRKVFKAVEAGTQVMQRYDSTIEFQMAVTGGVFYRGEAQRSIQQSWQQAFQRARVLLDEPAA